MSAIVCAKRSNSIFDELLLDPPPDELLLDSPPVSKRIRCSPGASYPTVGKRSNSIVDELLLDSPPVSKKIRCSPTPPPHRRCSLLTTLGVVERAAVNLGHLARLRSLFPGMDQQLLERALEASGNDLDSAIKSLIDLHLGTAELGFTAAKLDLPTEANAHLPTEGTTPRAGR